MSIPYWIDSRRDMRPGGVGGWDRRKAIFLLESFVLKKREYKKEEKEGAPVKRYWRKGGSYADTLVDMHGVNDIGALQSTVANASLRV
jgi:hypothetical protein